MRFVTAIPIPAAKRQRRVLTKSLACAVGLIRTTTGFSCGVGITYDLKTDAPPPRRCARRLSGRIRQPRHRRGHRRGAARPGSRGRDARRRPGVAGTAADRPAGLRLQLRRGPGHRPVARGAGAGRAGDARHPLHRLRSADPGRHARQGLRQAAGAVGRRDRPALGRRSSRTRTCTIWRRGIAALHGHRQAGLGRIEQGHPRQVRGGQRGRTASRPSSAAPRPSAADPGRGVHRRRGADGRRGRQRPAARHRRDAGAAARQRASASSTAWK